MFPVLFGLLTKLPEVFGHVMKVLDFFDTSGLQKQVDMLLIRKGLIERALEGKTGKDMNAEASRLVDKLTEMLQDIETQANVLKSLSGDPDAKKPGMLDFIKNKVFSVEEKLKTFNDEAQELMHIMNTHLLLNMSKKMDDKVTAAPPPAAAAAAPTGNITVVVAGGAPASPYGAPASPYGAPASPYGAPASTYGAPMQQTMIQAPQPAYRTEKFAGSKTTMAVCLTCPCMFPFNYLFLCVCPLDERQVPIMPGGTMHGRQY